MEQFQPWNLCMVILRDIEFTSSLEDDGFKKQSLTLQETGERKTI